MAHLLCGINAKKTPPSHILSERGAVWCWGGGSGQKRTLHLVFRVRGQCGVEEGSGGQKPENLAISHSSKRVVVSGKEGEGLGIGLQEFCFQVPWSHFFTWPWNLETEFRNDFLPHHCSQLPTTTAGHITPTFEQQLTMQKWAYKVRLLFIFFFFSNCD